MTRDWKGVRTQIYIRWTIIVYCEQNIINYIIKSLKQMLLTIQNDSDYVLAAIELFCISSLGLWDAK